MGENSAIEWTEATWNPVTGCTKVSPACANCYIERQTPMRVAGRKFVNGYIPLEFHENRLDAPLRRRKPTTYFVNSMSDLFHEDVPDVFIDQVFAVMAVSPRHTFQVLTKRAERMQRYVASRERYTVVAGTLQSDRPQLYVKRPTRWPLPNVWLGVSVENQHFADERIPLLLQTPAAVRFLSCEPLLGPVDLERVPLPAPGAAWYGLRGVAQPLTEKDTEPDDWKYWTRRESRVDWVIAGGESGPKRRPSDPDWFRSLRDQCVAAGVPFFFKQWGGPTPKSGGRLIDGREWSEMPAVAR